VSYYYSGVGCNSSNLISFYVSPGDVCSNTNDCVSSYFQYGGSYSYLDVCLNPTPSPTPAPTPSSGEPTLLPTTSPAPALYVTMNYCDDTPALVGYPIEVCVISDLWSSAKYSCIDNVPYATYYSSTDCTGNYFQFPLSTTW